jgi:DNA-binding winged helix-turn-helix (wHTH) protein
MAVQQLIFAPFRLDLVNEQLWEGEELVPLRPKLFVVLRYLAGRAGRLVTRAELYAAVWPATVVSESVLRGVIRELRDILNDDADTARFIETIPGRGYRFLPAVSSAALETSNRKQTTGSTTLPLGPFARRAPDSRFLFPVLVGREEELHQLYHWWEKAQCGARQIVFVAGEPEIGKTTLIDAFLSELSGQGSESSSPALTAFLPPIPVPWMARGQCIEHYGVGEAYLPVLEALGQLCRQSGGEQMLGLLRRYAPTWLVQMPAFIDDTEFEGLQRKVQGATRERMLREMAEALEALTAEQLLVLVLEDLHWSDHSTRTNRRAMV